MTDKEQIIIEKDIYTLTKADLVEQLISKTQEFEQLQEKYEALKLENEEGYEIVDELKHECEELKEKLRELELKNTTLQNRNQQLDGSMTEADRYREALEEIEKVINNNILNSCLGHKTDGCTPVHNVCEELIKILDIINKAKGERKCQ